MSIPADTIWETRQNGSDTLCGGGFSVANKGATGVDYSVQAFAQYTYSANLSATGTTTLTGVGFTNDILGNVLLITGQGKYCVTGFTSSTTITVDRALGTFSGGTGYLGGAFASPGWACSALVPGNTVYIKYSATPYTMTSTSANVAVGRVNLPNASVNTAIAGYDTTRTVQNTDTNRPTIRVGVNSLTAITTFGDTIVRNLIVDNPSAFTSATAFFLQWNYDNADRCTADHVSVGFSCGSFVAVTDCTANVCATGISFGNHCYAFGCVSTTCGLGFGNSMGTGSRAVNCICYNNTTSGQVSFAASDYGFVIGCISYGGTGAGYNAFTSGGGNVAFINCISVGAPNKGFTTTGVQNRLINCAGYGNGADYDTAVYTSYNVQNFISLSGDPFTNAAGLDFTVNNTAGAGLLLRGTAYPTTFPGTTTTNNRDIGAAQHAAAAAGGPVAGNLRGGYVNG